MAIPAIEKLVKEHKEAQARYANAVKVSTAIRENNGARIGTNAGSMTITAERADEMLAQEIEARREILAHYQKKIDALNALLEDE